MKKNLSLIFVVFGLVALAVLSRLVSHVWNFTILGGLAIFCGAFFRQKSVAVFVVLLSLLLSDAFIGFHNQMLPVYFSFLLMMALGSVLSIGSSRLAIVATTVLGSVLFFLITNFFVWFEGALYPQTAQGLMNCYLMGVPFYRNQLMSDVASAFVLFEVAKANLKFLRIPSLSRAVRLETLVP